MHDVSDRILNRIGGRKTYLAARSQTQVPDVKCNYDILYAVGPAPCEASLVPRLSRNANCQLMLHVAGKSSMQVNVIKRG